MKQNCRFCKTGLSKIFVDLGKMPLANSYLKKSELKKQEKFYPLCAFVCENCFLVQLGEVETAKNIFTNYSYFSSYSKSWLKHAETYVDMMIKEFGIDSSKQVVEIASNDGYLLQYFMRENVPVLGIEAAKNIAKVAKQKNIPTLNTFFDSQTAKKLSGKGKKADLIIGNNVLAHVPALNDFVKGLKILLKPNGIITMEFPHLMKLIKYNQFDTIYHEHYSYFSLFVVQKIFSQFGLKIFNVNELSTHGGSLRIFATHMENNAFSVSKIIDKVKEEEEEMGLKDITIYEKFPKKAERVRRKLCKLIFNAKKNNKKIICYGAPAKGNTLLNYCNITAEDIEYTVDISPHKQSLFLPGSHIPIKNPDMIKNTKPDYIIILPWNLKKEIMYQLRYAKKWKAKFIVPIPKVSVVE